MKPKAIELVLTEGNYITGRGHASEVFQSVFRKKFLIDVFGAPMHGTFNVKVPKKDRKKFKYVVPSYEVTKNDVLWKFYLCELSVGNIIRHAWILRWAGPDKSKDGAVVEIMSKQLLPPEFKLEPIKMKLFGRWDENRIQNWAPYAGSEQPYKWFQDFPWCPSRLDGRPKALSNLVWEAIEKRINWRLRTVLDVGCHTGFFSFKAAAKGAVVTAFDRFPQIRVAQEIGHHIECQDVEYITQDNGESYDIILFLSVAHQIDPTYQRLEQQLERYRKHCKQLVVELITPALKGGMGKTEIDQIVGGCVINEYQNPVRGVRKTYLVKGCLDA